VSYLTLGFSVSFQRNLGHAGVFSEVWLGVSKFRWEKGNILMFLHVGPKKECDLGLLIRITICTPPFSLVLLYTPPIKQILGPPTGMGPRPSHSRPMPRIDPV